MTETLLFAIVNGFAIVAVAAVTFKAHKDGWGKSVYRSAILTTVAAVIALAILNGATDLGAALISMLVLWVMGALAFAQWLGIVISKFIEWRRT